jgi:hypothetical protein
MWHGVACGKRPHNPCHMPRAPHNPMGCGACGVAWTIFDGKDTFEVSTPCKTPHSLRFRSIATIVGMAASGSMYIPAARSRTAHPRNSLRQTGRTSTPPPTTAPSGRQHGARDRGRQPAPGPHDWPPDVRSVNLAASSIPSVVGGPTLVSEVDDRHHQLGDTCEIASRPPSRCAGGPVPPGSVGEAGTGGDRRPWSLSVQNRLQGY